MSLFTLREPPSMSGNYENDMNEIMQWCREIYDFLWLSEFSAVMRRKAKGEENEG